MTVAVDTDYLIEQFFWQHLSLIHHRAAAHDFAAQVYPYPVQILSLGEREVERLGPILDELVTRTGMAQAAAGYFRTEALLLTVLEAITPHVRHAPVAVRQHPLGRSDPASLATFPGSHQFSSRQGMLRT